MPIKFVHIVFMLALVAVPLAAAADPIAPHLPTLIDATDELRWHMRMMLQRSATFRQQCVRLDIPRLRVQIRVDVMLSDRTVRARTTIQRTVDGDLVAMVSITPSGDPTEWLAHELEHILEQIEGVDLGVLARTKHDAWPSTSGAFESIRAIRAGQMVSQEVRDSQRLLARGTIDPAGRGDH